MPSVRKQEYEKKHVKNGQAKTEWKSMFHPTLCFSFSGLVAKCVHRCETTT